MAGKCVIPRVRTDSFTLLLDRWDCALIVVLQKNHFSWVVSVCQCVQTTIPFWSLTTTAQTALYSTRLTITAFNIKWVRAQFTTRPFSARFRREHDSIAFHNATWTYMSTNAFSHVLQGLPQLNLNAWTSPLFQRVVKQGSSFKTGFASINVGAATHRRTECATSRVWTLAAQKARSELRTALA